MRSRLVCAAVVALLVLMLTASAYAGVAREYEVMKPNHSDLYFHRAMGISDSGIVYGGATQIGTQEYGVYRYNVHTGAAEFTNQMHAARDINNSGAVVGLYNARNGENQYCVWNANGSVSDLSQMRLSSFPEVSINDSGYVMGERNTQLNDTQSPYFVWEAESGVSNAPTPNVPGFWLVNDFNNKDYFLGKMTTGTIVIDGSSPPIDDLPGTPHIIDSADSREAIWSADGDYIEIDIPDEYLYPASYTTSQCLYMNDLNQVAGRIKSGDYNHIFRWDSSTGVVDITAGVIGDLYCADFNNAGQVLIEGTLWNGPEAVGVHYIWDAEDGLVEVENLIDPASDWVLGNFRGFNSDGWIVSGAWNQVTHESCDIVLRPLTTPEPGSILAIAVGLIGLAGFTTRQRTPR